MLNYMLDSDLKAGMLVVLKNGYVGILLPWRGKSWRDNSTRLEVVGRRDTDEELHSLAHARLYDGNEDSTFTEFAIVEVYAINFDNSLDALNPQGRELLWKYEKPVRELTVEQIEKILGYKIRIVGEES